MKNKNIIFTKNIDHIIKAINNGDVVFTPDEDLYSIYNIYDNVYYVPGETGEDNHLIAGLVQTVLGFTSQKNEQEIAQYNFISDIQLEKPIFTATEFEQKNTTEQEIAVLKQQIKKAQTQIARKNKTIQNYKNRKSIRFFNKVGRFLRRVGVRK